MYEQTDKTMVKQTHIYHINALQLLNFPKCSVLIPTNCKGYYHSTNDIYLTASLTKKSMHNYFLLKYYMVLLLKLNYSCDFGHYFKDP